MLVLTGCASQGPLRPPSLHLPAQVRGLHAERVAAAVNLSWTNPVRTSDGVSLTGKHGPVALAVAICRVDAPGMACTPVAHPRTTVGAPGSYVDVLPPALAVGPARRLLYRVRTVNSAGGGMQPVSVEALAGAAPHAVLGLRAEPFSRGVALHWLPDTDAGTDRVVLHVTRGTAAADDGAARKSHDTTLAVEPSGTDRGGALDAGGRLGTAQHYTVVRTRTVHLPTGPDLMMSSAAATVDMHADAMPQPLPPPRGLDAVVSTLAVPEVALVWEPVDGAAGYRLFRSTGDGAPVALQAEPVTGFTYSDRAIERGRQYRYSMATVDSAGQTGPHSRELAVAVPAE